MKNLYEKINIEKETVRKYKPEVLEMPKYISENLKYSFFDWQEKDKIIGLILLLLNKSEHGNYSQYR